MKLMTAGVNGVNGAKEKEVIRKELEGWLLIAYCKCCVFNTPSLGSRVMCTIII